MSTNAIVAPACEIASVVAMKVFGTVTTMSPLPMPAAIRAKRSASVPLLTRDAVLRAAECGKLFFEALDLGAADEPARAKRIADDGEEFLFEFEVRGNQIQKWDWHTILFASKALTYFGRG